MKKYLYISPLFCIFFGITGLVAMDAEVDLGGAAPVEVPRATLIENVITARNFDAGHEAIRNLAPHIGDLTQNDINRLVIGAMMNNQIILGSDPRHADSVRFYTQILRTFKERFDDTFYYILARLGAAPAPEDVDVEEPGAAPVPGFPAIPSIVQPTVKPAAPRADPTPRPAPFDKK